MLFNPFLLFLDILLDKLSNEFNEFNTYFQIYFLQS